MIYDGKTYRNLEGQVKYLTEVAEALDERITEVAANIPSKMIVEELPETGDPNITYYVGPKGTEPNLYYEVWVWVQEVEDGPFVWRELEDTDQVDLSGYLPIQTGTTTYDQVYIKKADGTQGMVNVSGANVVNQIPLYVGQGQLNTASPTNAFQAANKGYVDTYCVAKQTGATLMYQLYGKATDGTQGMLDVTSEANGATVAFRDAHGRTRVAAPSNSSDAVNLSYANDTYVAQDKGGVTSYHHIYCKNPDGTQGWINGTLTPVANAVPIYRSGGTLRVATPTDNGDAATKAYVDATVGQLMYLHDIDLAITIDSTNKLFIKAYLVDGSSTAITTFDRIVYKRLDVQWGAFGPSSDNATPAAITKLPDNFRQDDFEEPLVGFLYQYFSGGNLVSANTTSIMTTIITDVVTTW